MGTRLLEVKNLSTYFYTEDGVVRAVDSIDFHLDMGETLGIVEESKSVTSLSVIRLVSNPSGKVVNGEIVFKGENLLPNPELKNKRILLKGDVPSPVNLSQGYRFHTRCFKA